MIRDDVRVDYISDIFATVDRRVTRRLPAGRPVREYAPAAFDCDRHLVIRNGRRVADDELVVAAAGGDRVTFARLPAGVVSAFLAPAATTTAIGVSAVTVVSTVLTMSLLLVSFGLRARQLSPGVRPQPPDVDERESPSRGFNGIVNTRGAGHPLPIVYGSHRVGGQIITQYQRPAFDVQVADAAASVVVRNDRPAGSKSTIYTRVALGAGPIQSISAIQFDDVAIGALRGVIYSTALGVDDGQSGTRAPAGFNKIGTVQAVNIDVTNAGGAQTFTTAQEVDALEVILRFPQGLYANFLGIIIGLTVEVKIEFRVSGGAWETLTGANIHIHDNNVSPVEYRVGFPPFDDRVVYDVRVTRIAADSFGYPRGEESAFTIKESINYTVDSRAHPGVAEVRVEHAITDQDAQLIPSRITSLVEGANDIRIYSDASTYSTGYTRNPAWILADFLTHPERGNGDIYTYADVDIGSFLAWASYCDELVDDGRGGTEARCRYDYAHDIPEDSQSVRNRMAFCGDAWVIQSGGKWRAVIDRAEPIADVFNDGNIAPGSLEYAYVPTLERATRIAASYTNAEINYGRDVAYDEDDAALGAGDTHREVAQDCFGMTRTTQVKRTLRRLLNWNRYSDRQLAFQTGLEGCILTAGSVFAFASRYAGVGLDGGRVVALRDGGKTLMLDGFIDFVAGELYEVIVRFGSSNNRESQTVIAPETERTDTVTVSADWPEPIAIGDQYSIGELGGAVETFRVISISTTDDHRRAIVARKYDRRVYDLGELVTPAAAPLPAAPNPVAFPAAVTGLTLLEAEPDDDAGNRHKTIVVGWEASESGDVAAWDIYFRRDAAAAYDETSFNLAGSTRVRSFVIDRVTPDEDYIVAVVAIGPSGNALAIEDSAQASITITA
jgi:predicted phage tail protein